MGFGMSSQLESCFWGERMSYLLPSISVHRNFSIFLIRLFAIVQDSTRVPIYRNKKPYSNNHQDLIYRYWLCLFLGESAKIVRFSKHKEPQLFIYFLKNNDEIKFQIFFFLIIRIQIRCRWAM